VRREVGEEAELRGLSVVEEEETLPAEKKSEFD